jgi:hypothetical protein
MQNAVLLEERAVDQDGGDPGTAGAGRNVAFRPGSRANLK